MQVRWSTLLGRMVKFRSSDDLIIKFVGLLNIALQVGYSGFQVSWSNVQIMQVGCSTFFGRMFNFCRLDVQLFQVGCSTFLGQTLNFCRSDVQLLQVGCSTFVGRIFSFCWSDFQLLQVRCSNLQVRCSTFVGRMFNYCRSDVQLLQVGLYLCFLRDFGFFRKIIGNFFFFPPEKGSR